MTPERAKYILEQRKVDGGDFRYAYKRAFCFEGGTVHEDGITEAEDAFIKKVWNKLPYGHDSSTYHSVICMIAYPIRQEDEITDLIENLRQADSAD